MMAGDEKDETTTYMLTKDLPPALLNFKTMFNIPVTFTQDVVGVPKSAKERDTDYQRGLMASGAYMAGLANMRLSSVADFWKAVVEQYGNEVYIQVVGETKSYTYKQIDQISNQVARWTRKLDSPLKATDVVAVLIENSAEMMWTWIGLCKAGITVALINTNLRTEALAHAIHISKANVVICSARYVDSWRSAQPQMLAKGTEPTVWWSIGSNPRSDVVFSNADLIFDDLVNSCSQKEVPRSYRQGITPYDPVFYIYTSGTTGPSKAVRFAHLTFMAVGMINLFMKLNKKDRFYVSLPLYHTAGQVVAGASIMASGCSMILKPKFSPATFWKDIQKYQCTAMIYIGELWRYLVTRPVVPEERNNTLRTMTGNGLRGNIWSEIVNRFQIERVCEFYGQTEGPKGSIRPPGIPLNVYNQPGACMYRPMAMRKMPGMDDTLIEFDVDANSPRRYWSAELGMEICQKATFGKPGLLIYELDPKLYDGLLYTDKDASEKPLLRDVFKKGDVWYSTGDLLRVDEEGFGYFVDRIGDTFRWKGENVSTNEVSAVIEKYEGVSEANVFGVEVADTDGRAGMAAVKMKPGVTLSLPDFHEYLIKLLPSYARPVFLRLSDKEAGKTSTFKFQKTEAQKQGFNPKLCGGDALYYSERGGIYTKITDEIHRKLTNGELRSRL